MTRIALSIPILLLLSIGFVAEPFLSHIPTQPNPARIRQAGPSTDLQVGFDCGLGSTAAVLNATSFPVAPSENGSPEILTSCAWIGDAGQTVTGSNDGTTEPLVTDQDETLGTLVSPAIGGGFTADVVVLQNSTTTVIDGFDLKVSWNPAVLRAAQIDQTGLIWKSAVLLTPVNNIDNNNGVAELAQVIQGTIGGNITIFRLRFDVVGVGIANLHLTDVSGGLANPGHVVHSNIDSAFDSESFYDPNHSLGWAANLTQLNPLVPGSPETFLVNNSCPGCTGPFTLEWQFNSSNTNQFSSQFLGNPLTITLPNNTFVASRLTVHVIDSATPTPHSVA
ncbi:MAG TPA: hypothetical protein VE955_05590, partial [Candidatus Dormibacteraeota bacterium]|nr:hypothetical protein [Candidatus Dormibacteraeota bacterium]